MSLDGQLERLSALYGEKSDDELRAMYADREDLTEVAQQALADVMRGRGVSAQAVVESPVESGEAAEVDGGSLPGADEVCVRSFDDAFEASEALRLLTAGGVGVRVVDWRAGDSSAFRGRQVSLGVVVKRTEEKAATAILTEKMPPFLPQEEGDPLAELGGLMLVGIFERADALLAAQALGEAGMSFVWDDGRDDLYSTKDEVSIQVKARRLEDAQRIVGERLGVE